MTLKESPTRYGRLSFSIQAVNTTDLHANITLPSTFVWPDGGLKVRLRAPGFINGKHLNKVVVDGQSWSDFNATEETVFLKSKATVQNSVLSIQATIS